MKKLIGLLILASALLLTGCATTGQVREIPPPSTPRVVVVYPEYYTPMYIHWRFDIGRGWHHYHHHHPRWRR
jgi:hypothetical protein